MANPKRKFVAVCLGVIFITGCTSVKMIRNPAEDDTGVRFYRPKPYLLVTPADPTGRLVNMKLEYLPDFSEEYSAHLKGKASVALKDGWNLVGVNTKDAPKDKEEPPAKIEDIKLPPAVVSATNVPIGYYESVYGYAGSRKFLQGWRYIGMTILGGGQPNVCRVPGHSPTCPNSGAGTNGCINGPLYGLVFFNGVMTFRQLDEIANNQLCPMYVNPTPADMPVTPPPVTPLTTPGTENQGKPVTTPVTPPLPAPAPPAPGSASLGKPKVSPALALAKPTVVSPALARPTVSPALAGPSTSRPTGPPTLEGSPLGVKPIVSRNVYVPLVKKAVVPNPVASTNALKTTPAKNVAAAPSGLAQDPLMGIPPTLDQDLYRTSTSPRP